MFERFTDRARKVMALANQEAHRFNHEYIETEHVLLGLIKEGSGVAATVLKNLDADLRKIRIEVEKLVKSGPEIVMMGAIPYTPRVKRVIEYSIEESKNLGHNYVGTEHLLLGLLNEQDCIACHILTNLNLSIENVRSKVLHFLNAADRSLHEKSEPVDNTACGDKFKYDVYESYFVNDDALLTYLNNRGKIGGEVVYMNISDTFGYRTSGEPKIHARIVFKTRVIS